MLWLEMVNCIRKQSYGWKKCLVLRGFQGVKGNFTRWASLSTLSLALQFQKVYAHMCSILEKHLNPTLGFHSFHICMFLNLDYDLLTELMHIFDKSGKGVLLIKVFWHPYRTILCCCNASIELSCAAVTPL